MREWRKTNIVSPEQKIKQNARAYAKTYRRRGLLIEADCCQDCISCETKLEMHHEDYAKPLAVIWLCRPCHLKRHLPSLAPESP